MEVPFKSIADDEAAAVLGMTEGDDPQPNLPFSQAQAGVAFAQGLYLNEFTVEVTDETLITYLKSFNPSLIPFLTLDDLIPKEYSKSLPNTIK